MQHSTECNSAASHTADCHSAKFHCTECNSAKLNADYHYAEFNSDVFQNANGHSAE